MALVLYECPPTRSTRDRWVLQELGVPFEAVVVNLAAGEHRSPAFLGINPAGKLPTLVDDGHVVTESAAIAFYLGDKYPEKGFLPQEVASRAQVLRWLFFTVTELEQPLWRMAKHRRIYPEALRLPAEIELAKQDFAASAVVLDLHMRQHEFVAADRITIADFVLAYTLDWANEASLLAEFPTLVGYMERMYARPRAPSRIRASR
ncbi:glutathione S-transferase family protein [Ramlibacter sp.]|uniref:glutathione S-transferase family protein n=1 Tax=Ramlibacter sp. TaxID=1917967 RepID=UPI002C1CE766|nr:glutathione S-transferase family protein [Ramlibacter sp.]HWI84643.1 glutathione S-transferase family protein [Ramlibacter sp.]